MMLPTLTVWPAEGNDTRPNSLPQSILQRSRQNPVTHV
jgi:hypothetical protein